MIRPAFVFLGASLFALVNCPIEWADHCRGELAGILSTVWRSLDGQTAKESILHTSSQEPSELIKMRASFDALSDWVSEEKRVEAFADRLAAMLGRKDSGSLKEDFFRRAKREKQLLAMRFMSMPAQVIFRDPSSWSSSVWINLGARDNQAIGRVVIAPNSPVLLKDALVGVVEYVGEEQSRVRLLTDAGLVLAVRAMRGGIQNRELSLQVKNILEHLRARPDLFFSPEEQEKFVGLLRSFEERLSDYDEEALAKGEICGCSAPLWRSRGTKLKGIGFNYDTPDEEGPARDLRSGRPLGVSQKDKKLIQAGDLLVTSGLDGVFPPGIPVAVVTTVAPLKEGSYSYELEAKSAAGPLDDLGTLFVLPPLGFTNENGP